MALRDSLERSLERLWYGPRGVAFALAAPLLGAASLGTLLASRRRHGVVGTKPALPTLAIGNLAIGGTGKTQVVLYLAARCANVAVVSRGYGGRQVGPMLVGAGANADSCGDEPLLLARRLPKAKIVVARDRALGIAFAQAQGCALVLLDDGLQQTRVEATHRIAVFGAEAPLGNGALLPLGPLRDPLAALRPTDLVWAHGEGTGTDLPRVDVRSRTRPLGLVPLNASQATAQRLEGRRLYAFAGIARPERFFHTLEQAGVDLVGTARFADHRKFERAELQALAARARALGAEGLVCTEKDAARITAVDLPIYALRTELQLLQGEDQVAALLSQLGTAG